MDNSTRRMINSLAEDVLSAYNISVPIGNIDEIVEKLGGTIQKVSFFFLMVPLRKKEMDLKLLYLLFKMKKENVLQ